MRWRQTLCWLTSVKKGKPSASTKSTTTGGAREDGGGNGADDTDGEWDRNSLDTEDGGRELAALRE